MGLDGIFGKLAGEVEQSLSSQGGGQRGVEGDGWKSAPGGAKK